MTVALVHGIPEDAQIWEPLQRVLPRPSIALDLPGFGTAAPRDWSGDKDGLADWLDTRLADLEPPVDVVAHDIGALLVMHLALVGRTPLASWVVDVPDLFAPDARFSSAAEAIQHGHGTTRPSPTLEDWAERLRVSGVPDELATRIAARHDRGTDQAIAAFYKSAIPNVAADWWPLDHVRARGRGLVLLLPDPPDAQARSRQVADRLDAATASLDSEHCWMARSPEVAAALFERFWADG